MTPFEELRAIILHDPVLIAELASIPTQEDLFARVLLLGSARGLAVSRAELENAVRANRRSWLERGTLQ
jgi:hypothetical protein